MSMQINCTLCDFVAKQQLELNTHAFSKHNQCVTCGNTFGNAFELISHKKSVHHKNRNTGNAISTPKSSPALEGTNLESNMNQKRVVKNENEKFLKENVPIQNLQVQKNLDERKNSESNMIRKRSHENSEKALPEQNIPIQNFKCDKCNFNAQQESLLKRHALCHVKVEVLEGSKLTDRCTTESATPKTNVPTTDDNALVDSKDTDEGDDDQIPDLSDHENQPSPPRPKASKKSFKRLINASNAGIVLAKKISSKENQSKTTKKTQQTIISKPLVYHCEAGCAFSTKSISTMSNHKDYFCNIIRKDESNVKMDFSCDSCDFTSQDSKSYSRHIRNVHIVTSDKRYKCDRCHFSTFDKYSLMHHIEENQCTPMTVLKGDTSGNQKVLKCDFCDDFEAISPFDVIAHLKESHVRKAEDSIEKIPIARPQKQLKLAKGESEEKIPIIRLERMNSN